MSVSVMEHEGRFFLYSHKRSHTTLVKRQLINADQYNNIVNSE